MTDIRNPQNWSLETKQLHIGQEQADPATDARAVPIYATASYVFHDAQHAADRFGLRDPGNIYSRLTNPTVEIFEKRIAALEGGSAAVAAASGAAAITYTFQALAKAGEHIVASKTIYGGTYNLLAHTLPLSAGIETTFVDPDEEGSFENAIRENTKAIFIEALGNPNSNLIDIEAVAAVAHSHGIPLVIDATFATPVLIRPINMARISLCIPPPSSSTDTEPRSAAWSLKRESLTGRHPENIRGFPIPTRAITAFPLRMRSDRLPL